MDAPRLIAALERFADALPAVVSGLDEEDARRRGAEDAWSILEIVTHLADEEVADFRTRLGLTLSDPQAAWPPIDPEGWAIERRYNEGRLDAAVARFVAERRVSVGWLRALDAPDWSAVHRHPKIGALRAGDLLAAWAAHDTLHLRQIARRLHELVQRGGGAYETAYAGRWPGG